MGRVSLLLEPELQCCDFGFPVQSAQHCAISCSCTKTELKST